MSVIEEALKELVDDLLPTLHLAESRSTAILQLLKDKGMVTDDELAPYLEQAATASGVKERAARLRFESLIESATKGVGELAQQSAKKELEENLGQDERLEVREDPNKEKDKEKVQRVGGPEDQARQTHSPKSSDKNETGPGGRKVGKTAQDNAA